MRKLCDCSFSFVTEIICCDCTGQIFFIHHLLCNVTRLWNYTNYKIHQFILCLLHCICISSTCNNTLLIILIITGNLLKSQGCQNQLSELNHNGDSWSMLMILDFTFVIHVLAILFTCVTKSHFHVLPILICVSNSHLHVLQYYSSVYRIHVSISSQYYSSTSLILISLYLWSPISFPLWVPEKRYS